MPEFANMEGWNVDGKQWAVPIDWGSWPIYNTEKVTAEEASSLQVLANPKFKDRVSLVDNVDDAFALGYLAVGID